MEGNGRLVQEIAELVKVHSAEIKLHSEELKTQKAALLELKEMNKAAAVELIEVKAMSKSQAEAHLAMIQRLDHSVQEIRRERVEDRRRWQKMFLGHERFMRNHEKRMDLHYRLIQELRGKPK